MALKNLGNQGFSLEQTTLMLRTTYREVSGKGAIAMKLQSKMALISLLLLAPHGALAYPVQGLGAASCAEFAKLYQKDPAGTESEFYYWAQGFMSGINISNMAGKGRMRDLGGAGNDMKRSLRTYCANNPLQNYMDGVLNLFGTLPFTP